MLIKLLTDVAMTAMKTMAEIDKMSQEEIEAAIAKAEATKGELTAMIRSHR
jgi:hypothetical protein